MPDGSNELREKGTPQGGVISPLLANLFLHYALDKWLENKFTKVEYERFADDTVLHCRTEKEAKELLEALTERFKQCKLELHPEKTKIVYCKDDNRRKEYPEISFTFLGFDFRQRSAINKKSGKLFLSFFPAISKKKEKLTKEDIRQKKIAKRINRTLKDIVGIINPIIRGKMNYYGRFYKSAMNNILYMVERNIRKWYSKKYRKEYKKAKEWSKRMYEENSNLFVH